MTNKHDCSIIRYLEKIATELKQKSDFYGDRARSTPSDLNWTSGVIHDYALEESYLIASSSVRGLSRDLAPEYLESPPHCKCQTIKSEKGES